MPQPARVSKGLRSTATQIAKIPDAAIADAVEDIVAFAQQTGGTFGRRRSKLTATAKVRGGKNNRTAEIRGRTAGAWTIKSYGRDGMTVRNARGFPIGSGFAASAGPAGPAKGGRRSWERVVEYANDRAPDIVIEQLDKAVD